MTCTKVLTMFQFLREKEILQSISEQEQFILKIQCGGKNTNQHEMYSKQIL